MITILIPTINIEKATEYARLMSYRAGMACDIRVMVDTEKKGWVAMINEGFNKYPSEFYIYAADDAYPSRGFVKEAMDSIGDRGLLAFNEGKYQDLSAGFALVRRKWVENVYINSLLCSEYKSHYSDVEIAFIAKAQKQYVYNPRTSLMEVVFNKDGPRIKGNNPLDEKTFWTRASQGFGGLTKPLNKG